jgi:hypothetical protein
MRHNPLGVALDFVDVLFRKTELRKFWSPEAIIRRAIHTCIGSDFADREGHASEFTAPYDQRFCKYVFCH